MTTLVLAFEKRENMSTEEFRTYYREEHASVVNELPLLAGYDVTFPRNPEEAHFDAVARLGFESPTALEEAMDSDASERMQADAENFVAADSMVRLVGETEDVLE